MQVPSERVSPSKPQRRTPSFNWGSFTGRAMRAASQPSFASSAAAGEPPAAAHLPLPEVYATPEAETAEQEQQQEEEQGEVPVAPSTPLQLPPPPALHRCPPATAPHGLQGQPEQPGEAASEHRAVPPPPPPAAAPWVAGRPPRPPPAPGRPPSGPGSGELATPFAQPAQQASAGSAAGAVAGEEAAMVEEAAVVDQVGGRASLYYSTTSALPQHLALFGRAEACTGLYLPARRLHCACCWAAPECLAGSLVSQNPELLPRALQGLTMPAGTLLARTSR